MYFWIQIASIFFFEGIFIYVHRDTSLEKNFPFCGVFGFGIRWPHRMSLVVFLPLQFFGMVSEG